MILFALLLGIFAYGVFFLGVLGLFNTELLFWCSFIYWGSVSIIFFRYLVFNYRNFAFDRITLFILFVISLSLFVNLIGALGPELAFDSLWYHLVLPKLYLEYGKIQFFSGGLLYYSAMPKFAELLYVSAFSFVQSDIIAKIIHYSFGVLGLISTYLLSRTILSQKISLIVMAVLASNLVFAWEMITSYTDLTWMFYEILAFYAFILFIKQKNRLFLLITGVFVGFTCMTKPVGVISLVIYTGLFLTVFKKDLTALWRSLIIFLVSALVIPLPWFVYSFLQTGNPFYPFFSGYLHQYDVGFMVLNIFNPVHILQKIGGLFLFASDPVSPLYLIFAPVLFITYKKFTSIEKIVLLYCLLSLILWYLIPPSGGARFMLPYLPVFSFSIGIVLSKIHTTYERKLFTLSVYLILFTLFTTILYRGVANSKYIPVIFGAESKQEFLSTHLNFNFGDFYDTDGYFENNLSKNQRVLLIGFHNLNYVNFPYVHESYHDGEFFTHVATQNVALPNEYKNWPLIYENPKTYVNLYARPLFQE